MTKHKMFSLLLVPLFAAGCENSPTGANSTDPGSTEPTLAPQTVAVGFGTSSTSASAYQRLASFAQSAASGADSLVVAGSNGMLVIRDVRFIVSEFELKRANANCDDVADEDACEKFQAPPSFVDLPLAGGRALAASQAVPADTFSEMEFEIEDLEYDEDDSPEQRAQVDSLFEAIRTAENGKYSDWPGKASMFVEGTFRARDSSEAVPFRVYFEAEIEVEREFSPPLVVTETAGEAVTVEINPALWFRDAAGAVVDLSALDYGKTGELVEFELEMEHGFGKAERKRDDDDD